MTERRVIKKSRDDSIGLTTPSSSFSTLILVSGPGGDLVVLCFGVSLGGTGGGVSLCVILGGTRGGTGGSGGRSELSRESTTHGFDWVLLCPRDRIESVLPVEVFEQSGKSIVCRFGMEGRGE